MGDRPDSEVTASQRFLLRDSTKAALMGNGFQQHGGGIPHETAETFLKRTLAALLIGALGFATVAASPAVTQPGGSPGDPEFQNLSLHSDRVLAGSGMVAAGNEP